jgi:hypothetical protein
LSLDDDVAALLEQEMRKTGKPLKTTVNELLRRGFAAPMARPKFVVEPMSLGLPPGMSYDNVHVLLEQLDELEGK